jgi:hypothetical protein
MPKKCGDYFHVYTPEEPDGDSHIDLEVQVKEPGNPRGCLEDGKPIVFVTMPAKKTLLHGQKLCAQFAGDPNPATCITMR